MSRYDAGLPAHDPALGDETTGRIHVTGPRMLERIATRIYAPQGIGVVPWFVAAGRSDAGSVAAEEGVLAGIAAGAAGLRSRRTADVGAAPAAADADPQPRAAGILDLEPANHGPYWRDDLGAGPAEVSVYCDRFRAGGGEELWLAPDARRPWLDRVSFRAWIEQPVVTRVLPQVYWRAFEQQPESALASAVATLREHGWRDVGAIHPILDGNAGPEEIVRAIRFARDIGCGGVSIFQRKNLRRDTAAAVLALDDPWTAATVEPHPHRDEILTSADAIRRDADRIAGWIAS